MCVFNRFQEVFGGTRDVYGSSRLRESLSGSLSLSSMWHVVGIALLGSRAGDVGEFGQVLSLLGGGGVFVRVGAGCGVGFVRCVVVRVGGVEGSDGSGLWLYFVFCLCVGWPCGWLLVVVLWVVLGVVRFCVRPKIFRRLPARKTCDVVV